MAGIDAAGFVLGVRRPPPGRRLMRDASLLCRRGWSLSSLLIALSHGVIVIHDMGGHLSTHEINSVSWTAALHAHACHVRMASNGSLKFCRGARGTRLTPSHGGQLPVHVDGTL